MYGLPAQCATCVPTLPMAVHCGGGVKQQALKNQSKIKQLQSVLELWACHIRAATAAATSAKSGSCTPKIHTPPVSAKIRHQMGSDSIDGQKVATFISDSKVHPWTKKSPARTLEYREFEAILHISSIELFNKLVVVWGGGSTVHS